MDIILIGRVAEAGTLEAVNASRTALEERYGLRYLKRGIEALEAEFADEECLKVLQAAGCDVFVVGRQGIYRALWALGETLSCGLRVRLEDISISQFVIEMAELRDENPYFINSLGCILACCESGGALVQQLRERGIEAHIIGFTTDDRTRGILNHGTLTYLTP